MNTISKWAAAFTLVLGTAYAQQPPDVVVSDGYDNTAMGTDALLKLTPGQSGGSQNTAAGSNALYSNTIGYDNTAAGNNALYSNTTGFFNTASGVSTLYSNTTGSQNTSTGAKALTVNTTGSANTASGVNALYVNTTGSNNTADGLNALGSNTTGNNNIAVGYEAGINLLTGSYNIDIGNEGETTDGFAANDGVIRIGTPGNQKETFIAGVVNSKITGSAVYVTTTGRLGVLASSERYKIDIAPMGSNTTKLSQLRPVTFKLKTDAEGTVQYGLIAEEVAKVYPELVIRDRKGRIDGVRYDELAPMLLNEVQKEQNIVATQAMKIAAENQRAAAQDAKIAFLEQQLAGIQAALLGVQSKDELVARR